MIFTHRTLATALMSCVVFWAFVISWLCELSPAIWRAPALLLASLLMAYGIIALVERKAR